jgi:hypothetical protein
MVENSVAPKTEAPKSETKHKSFGVHWKFWHKEEISEGEEKLIKSLCGVVLAFGENDLHLRKGFSLSAKVEPLIDVKTLVFKGKGSYNLSSKHITGNQPEESNLKIIDREVQNGIERTLTFEENSKNPIKATQCRKKDGKIIPNSTEQMLKEKRHAFLKEVCQAKIDSKKTRESLGINFSPQINNN